MDVHFSGYVPTPLGKAPGKVLCAGSSDGEHKCMTCLCWPAAHHFAILWASVGNTVPATFWALYYLINQQEALQVAELGEGVVAGQHGLHALLARDPHPDVGR